jgi:hypothetical protein
MSLGYSIYFAPVDRSWIGTPEFIRGVAGLFGVDRMESLNVWLAVEAPPGVELAWHEREEKILSIQGPSIETTVSAQRTNAACCTIMHLPTSETLTGALAEAVLDTLPEDLFEGWAPIYAVIHNGRWEVYDQGGDWVGGGACCVELGNRLGYPVAMKEYLKAFLEVPAVVQFQSRLEALSSQPWSAIIELT